LPVLFSSPPHLHFAGNFNFFPKKGSCAIFEPALSITAFGRTQNGYLRFSNWRAVLRPSAVEGVPSTGSAAGGHPMHHCAPPYPDMCICSMPVSEAIPFTCAVARGMHACEYHKVRLPAFILPQISGMSAIKGVWLPIQAVSGYPRWNDFPSSEASAAAQALM
jgi:hypothetical protein